MKYLLSLFMLLFLFSSCETLEDIFDKDDDDDEYVCPEVSTESVPSVVIATFEENFPGQAVGLWCDDTEGGYYAFFSVGDSVETLVSIALDGTLISVEEELEDDDMEEDDDDYDEKDEGCECEIDDDDDDDDDD